MKNELTKEQVVETIIDILIDVVGWVERDEISLIADLILDLHIDSDDLSLFVLEVMKHFGVRPTFEEWHQVGTIEEVADLVLEYLNQPNGSIPADSVSGK